VSKKDVPGVFEESSTSGIVPLEMLAEARDKQHALDLHQPVSVTLTSGPKPSRKGGP